MSEFLCSIVAACVGATIGIIAASCHEAEEWQRDAVSHHAAEYYLDAKHERQWRWLQPAQEGAQKP